MPGVHAKRCRRAAADAREYRGGGRVCAWVSHPKGSGFLKVPWRQLAEEPSRTYISLESANCRHGHPRVANRGKAAAKNGYSAWSVRRGGSSSTDLLHALEEYLPVLLGLVENGNQLRKKVEFVWVNQEDDAEETAMADACYELLSVLHLMAMLCLSQANSLLLPKIFGDGYQPGVPEESRRTSVDIFLKSAGYLDCAMRHVLPLIPPDCRRDLPVDLAEGNLRALSLQALGQGVDVQLGAAIDSPKATLAVKRRLACEMVKYWHQAQDSIGLLPLPDGWGKKHQLFVKWKFTEAKAAACYFHGLILDEGNTEKSHGMAVAALQASDEFLKESKKARGAFHTTSPMSRFPPLWGSTKYLSEKIPKDTSSKIGINRDLYSQERIIETAPALPDFALALKPDDYQLPAPDPSWNIGREEDFKGQGRRPI